ncbi:MAG TPA: hypothetical protein VGL61_30645 [Kofleriaceae bacterium]|jgi:hypothetical protein
MLTTRARNLLASLAASGQARTDALGMPAADVREAIAELEQLHDDDGRPVSVLKSWHADGELVALELTPQGKSLARALATS